MANVQTRVKRDIVLRVKVCVEGRWWMGHRTFSQKTRVCVLCETK